MVAVQLISNGVLYKLLLKWASGNVRLLKYKEYISPIPHWYISSDI